MIIVRPNGLRLFHAARMQDMPLLCDLVPLQIWHINEGQINTLWVPHCCGPNSTFHKSLLNNYVDKPYLANACGYPTPFDLSYGANRFFLKMALGEVKFHELYIGQCRHCSMYLTHWDGKKIHQCRT